MNCRKTFPIMVYSCYSTAICHFKKKVNSFSFLLLTVTSDVVEEQIGSCYTRTLSSLSFCHCLKVNKKTQLLRMLQESENKSSVLKTLPSWKTYRVLQCTDNTFTQFIPKCQKLHPQFCFSLLNNSMF